MGFKEFLLEARQTIPQIWYHGTSVDFKEFDLKYIITDKSNAADGPGFYLTNQDEDAGNYARGYIKTVELLKTTNIKLGSSKFNKQFFENIVDDMPDKEIVLSNWDENPKIAMRDLKKSIFDTTKTLRDIINEVWGECYKEYEKELLKKLVDGGIDGIIVKQRFGVLHLICFNKDILKIIKTEKL